MYTNKLQLLPECMAPDGAEPCAAYREVCTALLDAQSALNYIEQTHGRLYGVGWDRVKDKTEDLTRRLNGN